MPGQWIKQLLIVFAPYSMEISIGLLILLWLIYFIRYHIMTVLPIINEYRDFSAFLSELVNLEEENESLISKYIKSLKSKSVLVSIWNEYLENHETDSDPEQYFNQTTLIDFPAKRELAVSVPASLITIGLMASFFCLILPFVSAQSDASLVTVLYPAISEVVLVALFAFLLSYLFAYLNKSLFGKTELRVYEVMKLLNRKLVQAKDENQFDRMATAIDSMTSSLSTYAQYSADMQRSGMNQLADSFLESLQGEMHGQLQALAESFRNFTSDQIQSAEQAQLLVSELQTGAENQKSINDAAHSIISSIAQYHQQITNGSQHLTDSLQELQQLSETLGGMVSFNAEALDNMNQERENLKEEYGTYIRGMYDQIQQYQNATSGELEKAMTRFADLSNKTSARLEGSISKSMENWISSSRSLMQSMEEQSKGMNSVSREISLRLNDLSGSLKETMIEFTKAVEQGTGQTLSDFDDGLTEITQRLSQTISEIRDSIDDLPAVIDSLKDHLE